MPEISRVPPTVDVTLYAGDGVAIRYTIRDTGGNPYPLNGLVTSQIKAKRSDLTPLLTWEVDDSNQASGVVVLSLSGEQTASLITGTKPFHGVWDMQFVAGEASPITLLQGKVVCKPDVTR